MEKGKGKGRGGQGSGRGRQSEGEGKGPGGKCICPNCGYIKEHQRGVPCYEIECPECGISLVRD